MDQSDGAELIAQVRRELRNHGLHGALACLNERTLHRYTGVYLMEPPKLRSVCLYDRENPGVRTMQDLVLADTYCGMVGTSAAPLQIDNSLTDARLARHPARLAMQAYCGVPLKDTAERCFGTLCHWDTRPRLMRGDEMGLLQDVAPLFAAELLRERRRARSSASASSESSQVRVNDEANQLRR